jgi:hypothetical protein
MALHSSKRNISKRRAGRTHITETPLRIRVSGVDLTPENKDATYKLLGRRLARFGPFIERVDVRFKDVNGPARGGPDTRCRINLTVSGRPSVFAEERAHDADRALFRAASSVSRAMARSVERKGLSAPSLTRPAPSPPSSPAVTRGNGESTPAPRRRRPRRIRGMIYKLEESATTPSRKSSRKSKNRLKSGNKLTQRTRRRKHSPKARAARAQRQRRHSRR